MNLQLIQTLLEYHVWANQRMLAVIDTLTPEQFTRDLKSSFPSIQATVAHLIFAETIWLNRLRGESEPLPTPADLPTPAAARARWAASEERFRSFVGGLAAADLDRLFTARTSAGKEFVQTVGEALHQLFNHGTYHRGQLATMLRQLDVTPPGTDLITFYRERRAGATA